MKRIPVLVLVCLFLLPIAPSSGATVEDLPYPFFEGDGRPCVSYSTVEDVGAGQVRAVGNSQDICYWVASVEVYGVSSKAEVYFKPDWCPAEGCDEANFWFIPEIYLQGNAPFWDGYPLPAEGGTFRVGDLEWHTVLAEGENIFRLK